MIFLQILGILTVVILLYLVFIIFLPRFSVLKQPLSVSTKTIEGNRTEISESRKDVSFEAGGLRVSAWLYLPENLSAPVPCIVMNTGFGGTKDMILENYALRFQEAGMAVLTYDYRYFGESEGQPKQLFSISHQLEDCRAAIEYVRNLEIINPNKIAIWGTSAGGGYGLAIAATDKRVACVCAQVAGLDSKEDAKLYLKREGIKFFLRLFMHAQRDKGRSRFGLSAHKIPIVGKPGTLAMIIAPGAFEGYSKLVSSSFVNEVCARAILTTGGYNPIKYASHVQCPVLIQACKQDNLVSLNSALNAAEILGKYAEVKQYPIGHFDIYTGEYFEKSVTDQLDFLKIHLLSL